MIPAVRVLLRGAVAIVCLVSVNAWADDADGVPAQTMVINNEAVPVAPTPTFGGDKLLLTGGVSQLEGAGGGGLTPWAVISGYATANQIGASAFYTHVDVRDYHLNASGVAVGLFDRVEFSLAQQSLNTQAVGSALGLGRNFTLSQNIFGAKLRVLGDAVLDQDSWRPQIAVGLQYKQNDQGAVLRSIGARSDNGTDFYVSATKLFLSQSLLLNGTARLTKANQIGLLGFGGDRSDSYHAEFEASAAYLLNRQLAIGVEWRSKPDNLRIAHEDNWYDAFVVWAPSKHVSFTLAYADLGNIVIVDQQRGVYLSMQLSL